MRGLILMISIKPRSSSVVITDLYCYVNEAYTFNSVVYRGEVLLVACERAACKLFEQSFFYNFYPPVKSINTFLICLYPKISQYLIFSPNIFCQMM